MVSIPPMRVPRQRQQQKKAFLYVGPMMNLLHHLLFLVLQSQLFRLSSVWSLSLLVREAFV
jgi:hypothetical protein